MAVTARQDRTDITKKRRRKGRLRKAVFFICSAIALTAAARELSFHLSETQISVSDSDPQASLFAPLSEIVTERPSPADSDPEATGLEDALQALAKEDSRVESVIERMDEYPEELLILLTKNPEARDFVLDYTNHAGSTETGGLEQSELSGSIPLLLQWDERWGYFLYGSSVLGVTGCGPACLSMVVVGLTGNSDATPASVAEFSERSGYYFTGSGTSWDLFTTGAQSYGLEAAEVPLWEDSMVGELDAGRPIVASMGAGDFTDEGHFIVIRGYEEGAFLVNDPNSPARSAESWSYETLVKQIKCLWSFSLS